MMKSNQCGIVRNVVESERNPRANWIRRLGWVSNQGAFRCMLDGNHEMHDVGDGNRVLELTRVTTQIVMPCSSDFDANK